MSLPRIWRTCPYQCVLLLDETLGCGCVTWVLTSQIALIADILYLNIHLIQRYMLVVSESTLNFVVRACGEEAEEIIYCFLKFYFCFYFTNKYYSLNNMFTSFVLIFFEEFSSYYASYNMIVVSNVFNNFF